MPLINKPKPVNKTVIRVKIPTALKERMDEYCKWAQIGDISHFLTEAAEYVFAKDKEWKQYKEKINVN